MRIEFVRNPQPPTPNPQPPTSLCRSDAYPSHPALIEHQLSIGAGAEFLTGGPLAGQWTLKTALENASVHGSVLRLQAGEHGPFLAVHSFPEEHDEGYGASSVIGV